MSDTNIDDVEAAFAKHRETLHEIARSVGIEESALPTDPDDKAERAAFFGDGRSAAAYQKEAEGVNDLVQDVLASLELSDQIAAEVGIERSKRTGIRTESADATSFRKALRGGQ